MSTNSTSKSLQGWTSSPNTRGSLDIFSSCLTTIFLSTWSAICLNVSELSDTKWTILIRKSWLTILAIMAPECLLGLMLGQWQSARASVNQMKRLRQDDKWTLKHAFFADMGGFVLRTKDGTRFFLDTKHIHWLLEHEAISITQFEEKFLLPSKAIDDRNKSDISVRIISVGQAIWFCINIIARSAQHLAITTLEITTIGIIVNSIFVYYFWKDKPADVQMMEIVDIHMTLSEMIQLEKTGRVQERANFRTPFDFTSRKVWAYGLVYHYMMNMLKNMFPRSWRRKAEESFGRRSDNDLLPVTGTAWLITLIAASVFLGTNFFAWNFHFPTPMERLLWRLSSCGLFAFSFIGVTIVELVYHDRGIKMMQEEVQRRRKDLANTGCPGENAPWKERLTSKFRVFTMRLRNNSPENDSNMDVSIAFLTGVLLVTLYSVNRVYILVEDVIAFRALPADAYRTVQWTAFVLHIS